MKRIICYLKTIKDWKIFLNALISFSAIYVAHDFEEQATYSDGTRIYEPLKCKTCGHISNAYRDYK
jgi:hypothetical protein